MRSCCILLSLALATLVLGCGGGSNGDAGPAAPTPGGPTPAPTIRGNPTPTVPVESPEGGPAIALARAGGSIVRSEDGGSTWRIALPVPETNQPGEPSGRPFLLDRFVGWSTSGGQLFKTEDGGRTWSSHGEAIDVPIAGLEAVAFADRRRGVVVGYPPGASNRLTAAATTDGGESWSAATLEVGPELGTSLVLPSPPVCLTRAGVGFVTWHTRDQQHSFVTEDFGTHWEDASDRPGISAGRELRAVGCAGDMDLWLIEGEPLPNGGNFSEGRLLHSRNGGESFESVLGPAIDGVQVRVDAVHFVDEDFGWVATTSSSGLGVFYSADGGQSWELQFLSDEIHSTRGLAVDFANHEHGLVSFRSVPPSPELRNPVPVLLATDDGGRSWRRIELDENYVPYGPVTDLTIRSEPALRPIRVTPPPIDAPHALLTAREAGVFRSADGGVSWNHAFPVDPSTSGSPSAVMSGVALAGDGSGWAVGDRGVVLETEDGGRTWSSQTQNIAIANPWEVRWREVAFLDQVRGAMGGGRFYTFPGEVTRAPVLVYTVDGGSQWSPAEVRGLDVEEGLDPRVPRRICFTEDGHGLAADAFSFRFYLGGLDDGFSGKLVLLSDDAGASWENIEHRLRLPASFLVWDVACSGTSDLWIAGGRQTVPTEIARPLVFHSTDAGMTWREVAVPLPVELGVGRSVSGIEFANPAFGWSVAPPIGDPLAILRTFDGGASWETVLLSEDAAFDNAQVVLADERYAIVAASHVLNLLNRQPIVFLTEDGGDTWSMVEFEPKPYSRAFLDLAVAW